MSCNGGWSQFSRQAVLATENEGLEGRARQKAAGNYDRLLDFSRAVTGTLFFVPSLDLLEALVS